MASGPFFDLARQSVASSPGESFRRDRDVSGLCGDVGFRIGRDGTWFYHGSPIRRKPLVRLFASVLRRDPAGVYWLKTPVEQVRVAVDDAPFLAVEMTEEGAGRERILRFRTALDEETAAGPDRPIRVALDARTGEPSPYVAMDRGLEALIARSVFYDLVALAEEDEGAGVLAVWSGGARFVLGPAARCARC